MLAGVPLAFALDLDARAIDQQVQGALRAPIRDVHCECLLVAGQDAEVGHRPIEVNKLQKALDEAGRL